MLVFECVPEKNENRESTRFAKPAQILTDFFQFKSTKNASKKIPKKNLNEEKSQKMSKMTNRVKISKKKSKSKLTFVRNFVLKVVKMNMQIGFGNGSGLSPKPEDFEAFSGPENPKLKPAGFRAWYKINLISKKKKFQ